MFAIRGDARVQHRRVHRRVLIEPFAGQFAGVRLGCAGLAIPIDVGQERGGPLSGRTRCVFAVVICGVSDDAGAAFARTLAAGLLLGRHVLAVGGCAQQFARVGQLGLMVFAGLVEPAQPQCGHQILGAVGAQEQGPRAVAHGLCGARCAAAEAQRARPEAWEMLDCVIDIIGFAHTSQPTRLCGQWRAGLRRIPGNVSWCGCEVWA